MEKIEVLGSNIVRAKFFVILFFCVLFIVILFSFFEYGFAITFAIFIGIIFPSGYYLWSFLIKKIEDLEDFKDIVVKEKKEIIRGRKIKCRNCSAQVEFLFPFSGGICEVCVVSLYALEEAKNGVLPQYHGGIDAIYEKYGKK